MDEVLIKLDSAAKVKNTLGFVLCNVKTGERQYYYTHKTITLFEICVQKPI